MMPTRALRKKKSRGFYFPFEKVFSRVDSYRIPLLLLHEEEETESDNVINKLKEYYQRSFHESVYLLEISDRESKLKAIATAILKVLEEIPYLTTLIPEIQVAIAPDEDYEKNFFYVVIYLNQDKINEAIKAFDKLEDAILSQYPDKDIHILYSL